MKDYDDVEFCRQQLETLWQQSHDITPDYITPILPPQGDAMPTPYEIYIKVLIDAFGCLVEDTCQLPNRSRVV